MKRRCILILIALLLVACYEDITVEGDRESPMVIFNVIEQECEVTACSNMNDDGTRTPWEQEEEHSDNKTIMPLWTDSTELSDYVLIATDEPRIAPPQDDVSNTTRTAPQTGTSILANSSTFSFSSYKYVVNNETNPATVTETKQYNNGTATITAAPTPNQQESPTSYSTTGVTTNKTWPSDAKTVQYKFYAWKNTTASGLTVNDDGKTFSYNISSVNPTTINDLVTASSGAVNYSVAGPTLTFNHALAAVVIKTAANFSGTVTSVKFKNICTSGTITAGGSASTASTQGSSEKLISGLSVAGAASAQNVFNGSTTLMMLPQNVAGSSIEITVNDATQTNPQVVHTLTANLTGSWEAGHTYTYTIGSGTISAISLTYPQWALSSDANTKDYGAVGSYTTATAASNADYGFIGLYAIDNNNNIVICNAKLSINSVSNHTASCALPTSLGICSANYSYYAYYPYSSTANTNIGAAINGSTTKKADNTNQTVNKSTNAATFFANLIDKWAVKTNQSTLANYHLSDLQVGKGSVSNGTLSFAMAHQMGLININLTSQSAPETAVYDGNTATLLYNFDNTSFLPKQLFEGSYTPRVVSNRGYFIAKIGSAYTFGTSYKVLNNGSATDAIQQWHVESTTISTAGKYVVPSINLKFKNYARLYKYNGSATAPYTTGSVQTYTPQMTCEYKMECWGAKGGNGSNERVGKGGYTAGTITWTKDEPVYVYVGGRGVTFALNQDNYDKGRRAEIRDVEVSGAWNGGGPVKNYCCWDSNNGTGGGATDIRTVKCTSDTEWGEFASLKSRIMVAGGGGGMVSPLDPANAGGLEAPKSRHTNNTNYDFRSEGATQTTGFKFGLGGSENYYVESPRQGGYDRTSGGGGYMGGNMQTEKYLTSRLDYCAASGGSSFISGHAGCIAILDTSSEDENGTQTLLFRPDTEDAVTRSTHYSNKVFSATVMIDGGGYQWTTVKGNQVAMPNPESKGTLTLGYGNLKHGFARITIMPYN